MNPNNPCAGFYGKCLDVKITNKCNGKCAFCIEKGGYAPKEKSVQELIAATNALDTYRKVLILGGEPFLYEYLAEYVEGLEKDEIYITTNGSAFADEVVDRIAPKLENINISIHHYDEIKNEAITGLLIDPLKIKYFIAKFKKQGVGVRINTNLVKGYIDNLQDAETMVSYAKLLGADAIRFAELQNCPELFANAKNIFAGVTDNPYLDGCEMRIHSQKGIDVLLRLTCGIVNPLKPIPPKEKSGNESKVMYPSAETNNGWKGNSVDCHRRGSGSCH